MSMTTVKFSHIIQGVKDLIGLDSTETIKQRNLIRGLVSQRLGYIWEQTQWPAITKWEERTVTDDTTNGDYVPLTESGKDDLEAVFAVRDKNPIVNGDAKNLGWRRNHLGIVVPDGYTSVWVYYRRPKPRLTGDAYSSSTAYAAGEQVYHSGTGDFYNCILNIVAVEPPNATFWEKVEIPTEFEAYLVNGAYADYLRNDGQEEKSVRVAEQPAQRALKHALYNLKQAQGQQVRPTIKSY